MKSLAACTIVLALAACSTTSTPGTTTGTSGSGATGAKSTGTSTGTASGGHGSSTGTAAGSSTGSPLGMKCTYDTSTGDDSCTDEGYECTAEFSSATPATCVLPQDLGICDGDPAGIVGCQDGGIPNGEDGGSGDLDCSPGFENTGTGAMFSLCVYNCTATTDCGILIQSCISQLGVCFQNYCDDTNNVFTGPFFNTCPVLAADDGQCLSFNTGGVAICFPNGTADVGEPCTPTFRGGAFSECKYGNYCQPNAAIGDGGLCFPITIDGGSCAAGDDPVTVQTNADWAICAQDCTTSMSCDGGVAGTSCQALTGGTTALSVCLP